MSVDLRAKIRDIPDFPRPGIVFKDIMPLLEDPEALHEAVEALAAFAAPRKPDLVLGAEARGFILGGALAYRLGCGFVAARKPGKLPWHTVTVEYALEYGGVVVGVAFLIELAFLGGRERLAGHDIFSVITYS